MTLTYPDGMVYPRDPAVAPYALRRCRVCGTSFETTHPHWQTCSYACSRLWPEYADSKAVADHLLEGVTCDRPDICEVQHACTRPGCFLPSDQHPSTVPPSGMCLTCGCCSIGRMGTCVGGCSEGKVHEADHSFVCTEGTNDVCAFCDMRPEHHSSLVKRESDGTD